MGMTGKSEEGGADGAGWLAAVQARLIQEVEAVVGALCEARPKADADSAALDRHARAIVNVARAASATAGLTETPGRGRSKVDGEDMSKKADDISPERLERVCEDIIASSGRLLDAYERKRVADGVFAGGAAGDGRGAETDPGAGAD